MAGTQLLPSETPAQTPKTPGHTPAKSPASQVGRDAPDAPDTIAAAGRSDTPDRTALAGESTAPGKPVAGWVRYRPVLTSRDFVAAALTALLVVASWSIHLARGPVWLVTGLGVSGALAGGSVIAWGAVRGVLRRDLNVDELVTIAMVAALLAGEYWGAALVAFMMLFGKVLEDVTAARAEAAIEGLGQLLPAVARVQDAAAPDGERVVPVDEVRTGDVLIVRPGERLPVDGEVVAGQAAVEEAAITGEPLPAEKRPGSPVFAGTLATGGALEVRATRTGEATTLGRIAALVREAEAERAPIVRTADRWARWFTPAVLALAGAVYLVRQEALPAITVLVVACPCALVLATPTAMVAGIARGARRGILVKGGARLEAAGHADAVCIDKTGTLTLGRPALRRVLVFPSSGRSDDDVLAFAAAAERLSEHPLARAVAQAARERGLAVAPLAQRPQGGDVGSRGFVALAGRGVVAQVAGSEGTVEVAVGRPELLAERHVAPAPELAAALRVLEEAGETPLLVALDGRAAGVLGVADTPRPEAAAALRSLRQSGVRRLLLLTGDQPGPARAVASAVGIPVEDVHAGLLPEDKVAWVRRLQAEGHRVAMIGDGVNDAPALAAADVAVALGAAGTDLAMAAADIVLLTDDLRQAAAAIALSRQTLRTIKQNLWFAASWNAVAIVVAAAGGVGPVGGALVHNAGSVAVVMNAARLINARLDGPGRRSQPGPSATASG